MKHVDLPKFPTRHGYMSERTQQNYIAVSSENGLMPKDAHRIAELVSLTASSDTTKPIQFWQLYSVLGQDPIVGIVERFYTRVFEQEDWFKSVFERVGGINHHINTQASMWIDVMGGGPYYHGAEYRLSFHHHHNALQLMNEKGAELWSKLMLETLEASGDLMTDDPRVRISINTFLAYFMGKYADEFAFENRSYFGETNGPFKRKINLMRLSAAQIEALSEDELGEALSDRGVDLSQYANKAAKVNKALML
ncbi:hypothetical protein [Planktotalea sp.]|uniref:globin domain-containing protein n=1 Tax=Planktotalea sp. TaxID=2029877 RepID=UPI003D6A6371